MKKPISYLLDLFLLITTKKKNHFFLQKVEQQKNTFFYRNLRFLFKSTKNLFLPITIKEKTIFFCRNLRFLFKSTKINNFFTVLPRIEKRDPGVRLRKQKEGKAEEEEGDLGEEGEVEEEEGEPEVGARGQGLFGFVVAGRGSRGGPGEGVG